MDFKIIKPCLILAILLAATVAAVLFFGEPGSIEESGIIRKLPDTIGAWKGNDVFYCNSMECMNTFAAEGTAEGSPCPYCGEPLSLISKVEASLLPEDTLLARKRYRNPAGEQVVVTILITGAQRSSIHRPEWCLPAQGHSIVSSRPHKIPLKDRDPVTVRLLELRREPIDGSQRTRGFASAYAYWFVSRERETAYHLNRMLWMAFDSIFRNTTPSWAFISVATGLTPGSDAHMERIEHFVWDFYPLLTKPKAQP
jgi:EpsI family protein